MYRSASVPRWIGQASEIIVAKANEVDNIESAPYPHAVSIRVAVAETLLYGTRKMLFTLLSKCEDDKGILLCLRYLNVLTATLKRPYVLPQWLREKLNVQDVQRHIATDVELVTISSHYYQSLSDSGIILHPSMLFGTRRWWEEDHMRHIKLVEVTAYDIPDLIGNFRTANNVHNDAKLISEMRKVIEEYYPQIHTTLMGSMSIWNAINYAFRSKGRQLLNKLRKDDGYGWLLMYINREK